MICSGDPKNGEGVGEGEGGERDSIPSLRIEANHFAVPLHVECFP